MKIFYLICTPLVHLTILSRAALFLELPLSLCLAPHPNSSYYLFSTNRMRASKRRRVRRRRMQKTRKRHSGGSKLTFNSHKPVFPPKEINDLISHVIFINLNKRVDRRKHIERELSVFEPSKVTRLAAVEDPVGRTGCAKSHLKALEMARDAGYPNVLIVEDDAFWNKVDESYPVFERLISQPYDGIMVGSTQGDYDKTTLRLNGAYSTTAYIVHERFYPTLIELFETALAGDNPVADVITRNSHGKGEWYVVVPSLMSQIPGFSNINGKSVNHQGAFN